jgi:hypothetical protein
VRTVGDGRTRGKARAHGVGDGRGGGERGQSVVYTIVLIDSREFPNEVGWTRPFARLVPYLSYLGSCNLHTTGQAVYSYPKGPL